MRNVIEKDGVDIPVGDHLGKVVVFGCDHRGFKYREDILRFLQEKGLSVIDCGCFSEDRCDYPVISDEIGKKIGDDVFNRIGIGICGSGIGILINGGKHKRVFCARCLNTKEAETSRMHNNTNMLGLGADYMDLRDILETISVWLNTEFGLNERDEAYIERYVQTVKLEDNR